MPPAAVVGLERTFYQVSEDVGVVEVCAIVFSPNGIISCPIAFSFDVSLSTNDNSAGEGVNGGYVKYSTDFVTVLFPVSPMDYAAEISAILTFAACQRRRCVNVTIENDAVLEDAESFDVTLERTFDLDNRITLDPVDGEIEITDNDSKSVNEYQLIVI